MQLSPTRFNSFLGAIGQDVEWRRASLCPCRDQKSGAAVVDCPVCDATGMIWDAPIASVVGVTGMKVKRQFANFGAWEAGDEMLTIPSNTPMYACGENDRVVMVDSSYPFQFDGVRGSGNEKMRFQALSIDSAIWLDPAGTEIVKGDIPTVAPYSAPVWDAGEGPPAGTQYSLRGRRRQEYFLVDDLPQDRAHFHGLALPRLCHFRNYQLFGQRPDAS